MTGNALHVTMPDPDATGDSDQRVLLHGISWAQYVALTDAGDHPGLRMTYLEGDLEIMSPGRNHEHWKKLIARLVEAYADARDIPLIGVGSMTLRKQLKKAGVEPDESYFLRDEKEYPDLAIEVVLTSSGLDKLEVYRRLRVAEVWFFVNRRFRVFRPGRSRYSERTESGVLPGLDLHGLADIVASASLAEQPAAVKRFRLSLRKT